MPPAILWLRQDLRTTDHPALLAAIAEGPVIPLYILDDESPETRAIGGAQRWWLHHSLAALDASLRDLDRVLAASERQSVLQLSALRPDAK